MAWRTSSIDTKHAFLFGSGMEGMPLEAVVHAGSP
jgi:hypothetical protein